MIFHALHRWKCKSNPGFSFIQPEINFQFYVIVNDEVILVRNKRKEKDEGLKGRGSLTTVQFYLV